MLKQLYEIPASYHVVREWHTLDNVKAKSRIERHRRHFHNTKTSLVSQAADAGSDVLVDDSKTALVESLAELKKEIEINGNCLGEFSMSVVVRPGSGPRRKGVRRGLQGLERQRWLGLRGAVQSPGRLFATLPGNYPFNLRHIDILNTNYADYSFKHKDKGLGFRIPLGD